MKGGTIEVTGNASDWVGGEMTGRPDPRSRQRRRPGRGGLPRQPGGHEGRHHPHRRHGGPGSRHAHATGDHRRRRPGARLRRPADEGRHHLPARRGRDPHRRLDGPRHDRLPGPASASCRPSPTPAPTTRRSCASTPGTCRRWASRSPTKPARAPTDATPATLPFRARANFFYGSLRGMVIHRRMMARSYEGSITMRNKLTEGVLH